MGHDIALDMHRVNATLALVLETEAVVIPFRVVDGAVQVLEIDAGVEGIKERLKVPMLETSPWLMGNEG